MVRAPLLQPAESTDAYALQVLEWLQEAATFVQACMGRQLQ